MSNETAKPTLKEMMKAKRDAREKAANKEARKLALLPLRNHLLNEAKFRTIREDYYISLDDLINALYELEETGKIEPTA